MSRRAWRHCRIEEGEFRCPLIAAGHSWIALADALSVYTDRGISPGMEIGIAAAQLAGVPIEYRTLKEEGDDS